MTPDSDDDHCSKNNNSAAVTIHVSSPQIGTSDIPAVYEPPAHSAHSPAVPSAPQHTTLGGRRSIALDHPSLDTASVYKRPPAAIACFRPPALSCASRTNRRLDYDDHSNPCQPPPTYLEQTLPQPPSPFQHPPRPTNLLSVVNCLPPIPSIFAQDTEDPTLHRVNANA